MWYARFKEQKPRLKEAGIKSNLGHILLTGRDSDILVLAMDEDVPVANAWGRLIKKFTHFDRLFVYPERRGEKVASTLVLIMLYFRKRLIWNAVHPAMDHIARKFGGVKELVEGYNGWVLRRKQYPGDLERELSGVEMAMFCDECRIPVPAGEWCVHCGTHLSPAVKTRWEAFEI